MQILVALIASFAVVVFGNWMTGGGTLVLFSAAPLFVVLAGTITVIVVAFPGRVVKSALQELKALFSAENPRDAAEKIAKELGELASAARKEGFLSLDAWKTNASTVDLREGVGFLMDGFEADAIKGLFEDRIASRSSHSASVVEVFEMGAKTAPAVGVMGAILGLIEALSKLEDPAKLGGSIAGVFVSILYGLMLANFVFSPLAERLRRLIEDRTLPLQMIRDGIIGIQAGANPHMISERMRGRLHASG